MIRRLSWTGLGLGIGVWLCAAWAGAVAWADKKEVPFDSSPVNPAAAQEAIEKSLASPTELDFVDTPLADVCAFLGDKHRIWIRFDAPALEKAGIEIGIAVTRSIKGVSLDSALDLLLRDLGLTYTIKSEVVLITTQDQAQQYRTTKVYDVSDLVAAHNEKNAAWDDFGSLIDAITTAVRPASWARAGGAGSIAPITVGKARVVTICQTYKTHREIAKLLENLRAAAKQAAVDEKAPVRPRPAIHGGNGGR